jgi:hypothetical protein
LLGEPGAAVSTEAKRGIRPVGAALSSVR